MDSRNRGLCQWNHLVTFFEGEKNDLNIKGAYLHMLADTLVSLGVVVSGIIISYTQWYTLDAYMSLLIAVFIIITAIRLLQQSVYLMLDAVPHSMDVDQIKMQLLCDVPTLRSIHHIHIWSLSTTMVALTAHVSTCDPTQWDNDKARMKSAHKNYGIDYATLELELHIDNEKNFDCFS